MPLQYKKVLLVGETSGIGKALAERFVETGTFVIIVGRRREHLAAFARRYANGKTSVDTEPFDVSNLAAIPQSAANVFIRHSNIDCGWLNSEI
jgi:NADP-dependent 3-hydroxy acid dehydrogenase YdfG